MNIRFYLSCWSIQLIKDTFSDFGWRPAVRFFIDCVIYPPLLDSLYDAGGVWSLGWEFQDAYLDARINQKSSIQDSIWHAHCEWDL